MMSNPTVSFVVPCYKLAHLLPECVHSILAQTYRDFEVLIMDDCSPDDTAEVARSFGDSRIKHVRHSTNLGHLRNYNAGIALAEGKYLWLISADDCLRRPYVLQRYIRLLEAHPNVGYTCCSGVRVRDGVEAEVVASYATHDVIVRGRAFLKALIKTNFILTASGLVRRECYDRLGVFPLTMPWAGDWFLWCLFALHYDVGYFAEPMVCYRDHSLSMTKQLTRAQAEACSREEIAIPWIIKRKADDAGYRRTSRVCLGGAAEAYARSVVGTRYCSSRPIMDLDQFEVSLAGYVSNVREKKWVRARVYAAIGNEYYWQGRFALAQQFYGTALRTDPFIAGVLAKRLLLALGRPGQALRTLILRASH